MFKPIWVFKELSDGYGYDIYSFDLTTSKEKLIEVKSGLYDKLKISENEYNTMKDNKTIMQNIVYINIQKLENNIETKYLINDYINDKLIDQNNNEYLIQESVTIDDHNNDKKSFIVKLKVKVLIK